jgi:hypothetical protein
MAYTVTKIHKHSVGDKTASTFLIVADGAEANLSASTLGMKYIDYLHTGPKSMADAHIALKPNQNSSGAAANGGLGVSGVTSGDEFFLTVYGR